MNLVIIGLGILIIFLVVTGKWNDFVGAIFNPITTTPQGKSS